MTEERAVLAGGCFRGVVGLENPGTNLSGKTVHGTRRFGWGDQGRSEVIARYGMVATSHHPAAQAGMEILEMEAMRPTPPSPPHRSST